MADIETIKKYNEYVKRKSPTTRPFPSLVWAFLIGGLICTIGQGFYDLYSYLFPEFTKDILRAYTLVTMIFWGTFLTGIGVYDKIGAFAGAGSIIPITGFANSIASPAIEFKTEGWIFGMCVKMFTIAGPVIVNGIVSSIAVGLVYLIFGL